MISTCFGFAESYEAKGEFWREQEAEGEATSLQEGKKCRERPGGEQLHASLMMMNNFEHIFIYLYPKIMLHSLYYAHFVGIEHGL